MTNMPLKSIEQKEISFYGDELTAVRASDEQIYASLRHMCQALDIDTTGQRQRIQRHKVLKSGLMVCKIQTIQGERDAYVLRVDLVPLWLTGISTRSIKDSDIREKLERFQTEAAKVLWEAFQDGRLTADPLFSELLQQTDSEAVQAYKLFEGLLKLARNQIILEARIDQHDQTLVDYGRRLETIEADMGQADRHITESQATQISQAIRSIALVMSKASGQNEYGRCWGEFYRKFGVSKYRHLPTAKFDEAIRFLDEWHQSLVGDSPF